MKEDLLAIESYIAGNAEAFEALVVKYQKQIYALAYRMTNNIEDAKDLTQMTFLNALKGVKDFRGNASFKTWLYQIAINTSLNHIKKNRHSEVELGDEILENQSGALSMMIDKEKSENIKNGLKNLPERQKLAVILRVYDALSCSETAVVMGCSEGAVKAHYHNGVKKLREIFRERGYAIKS